MKFKLELAHLQLTLRCNLRCPFCGQWGKHGFANGDKNASANEMSEAEWLKAIGQLHDFAAESGSKPGFIIWGGEPLLHPAAGAVLRRIKELGCKSAIVTNGTLLEKHASEISGNASVVYVSLDGPGELHDRIRNSPGLHKKIERGLASLPREGLERTALAVITESNIDLIPETARYAGEIGFDKIIFQNLIYMLPEEARRFDSWIASLGIKHSNSSSWERDSIPAFSSKLPEMMQAMEKLQQEGKQPIKAEFHPRGLTPSNVLARMEGKLSLPDSPPHCLAPFRHLNVAPDGGLRFCVDYNELALGSMKDRPLAEILSSELAEEFQSGVSKGMNPACSRCPWQHISCYESV